MVKTNLKILIPNIGLHTGSRVWANAFHEFPRNLFPTSSKRSRWIVRWRNIEQKGWQRERLGRASGDPFPFISFPIMLLNKQSRESCTYVNTRAELPMDPAIRDSLVNPMKKKKRGSRGGLWKGRIGNGEKWLWRRVGVALKVVEPWICLQSTDPFLKDYRYKLYISRVGHPVHPGRHIAGWPVAA